MPWDKRDDDLAALQPLPPARHITLLGDPGADHDLAGKLLKIKLGRRQVLWKSPVVQRASVTVDRARGRVFIRFYSTIHRQPRYLRHWKRIEDYTGMGIDVLTRFIEDVLGGADAILPRFDIDRWVKAQIPREQHVHLPPDLHHDPADVDPYRTYGYPCPDLSIHLVRINALEQGKLLELFNEPITAFEVEETGDGFLFSYCWAVPSSGELQELSRYLLEPGIYKYATYIVFEDLVGHVIAPESMIFASL